MASVAVYSPIVEQIETSTKNTSTILTVGLPEPQSEQHAVILQDSLLSNKLYSEDLIVSPYPTAPHRLQLSRIEPVYQLFALALTHLEPITASYATTAYEEAFNWTDIFSTHLPFLISSLHGSDIDTIWPLHTDIELYTVLFRSTLNEGIDRELLGQLDSESHVEATTSGGLLKYWFGSPNAKRQNLATCLWRSSKDAVEGGKGPWHKKARSAAAVMYEKIEFTRLRLQVRREEAKLAWQFHEK